MQQIEFDKYQVVVKVYTITESGSLKAPDSNGGWLIHSILTQLTPEETISFSPHKMTSRNPNVMVPCIIITWVRDRNHAKEPYRAQSQGHGRFGHLLEDD